MPEVLAGEAGLVAELLLDPGRERLQVGTVLDLMFVTQEDIFAVWVYLSSWLYLAKRSDRHGAPVLICESKELLF